MSAPICYEDMEPQLRFTGFFIPVEILEMKELNHSDILLLLWIDAFYCQDNCGCFATNEELGEKMNVKANTISKGISKLRNLGLVLDVSFNGRKRVIRAVIYR